MTLGQEFGAFAVHPGRGPAATARGPGAAARGEPRRHRDRHRAQRPPGVPAPRRRRAAPDHRHRDPGLRGRSGRGDLGRRATSCSSPGVLKRVAVKLSKICNDLRLLSSGPRAGFGEINLPARQAGSSIMPGKVNPVIPEVVNQVAFEVIGNDVTVTFAAESGQLQLNAFEPIIAHSLFASLDHLAAAATVLADKCIDGITANRELLRDAGRQLDRAGHRAEPGDRLRERHRRRPGGPGQRPRRRRDRRTARTAHRERIDAILRPWPARPTAAGMIAPTSARPPSGSRRGDAAGDPAGGRTSSWPVSTGPDCTRARHYGALVIIDRDGSAAVASEAMCTDRCSTGPAPSRSRRWPCWTRACTCRRPDLALAAASHSGEPEHVGRVLAMLDAVGLTEDDLRCPGRPARRPGGPGRGRSARGGGPRRVYMNCSGKHAAMVGPAARRLVDRGLPRPGAPAATADPGRPSSGSPARSPTTPSASTVAGHRSSPPTWSRWPAASARWSRRQPGTAGTVGCRRDAAPSRTWSAGATSVDTLLMTGYPGLLVKLGADGVQALRAARRPRGRLQDRRRRRAGAAADHPGRPGFPRGPNGCRAGRARGRRSPTPSCWAVGDRSATVVASPTLFR